MMRLNIDFDGISAYTETEGEFKQCLAYMYSAIGHIPHKLLGINIDEVRNIANNVNAKDIISAYTVIKSSDIKKCSTNSEYGPLCESLLAEELIKRYYPGFLRKAEVTLARSKFKDKLLFTNDSKDWIIIKKMSVSKNTSEREAAAFLFGVKASIFNKYLSVSFGDNVILRAEKITKGKRKSIKSLKAIYEQSQNGKNMEEFICSMCILGYVPTPSHGMLKKVFPELKLPGIRGRKPKK